MSTFDAEARDVTLDGTTVRCHVAGPEDAPPVVLLHGGGVDAADLSWAETLPGLADSYRVYAPDWPGYGESDRVPDGVTPDVDYYVDVLYDLLEALDVVEVTLVGTSLGGGVALGYTLEYPARISRLVLVGSYGLGRADSGGTLDAAYARTPKLPAATWWAMEKSRRVTRAVLETVVEPSNVDERLVDEAHAAVRRPDAGEAYRRLQRTEGSRTGIGTTYADRMDELPVPTLFVHGEDDEVVPPEQSKRAADVAPVAELFTLAECGHWPSREHPEAFVSRLEVWLEHGRGAVESPTGTPPEATREGTAD